MNQTGFKNSVPKQRAIAWGEVIKPPRSQEEEIRGEPAIWHGHLFALKRLLILKKSLKAEECAL